MNLHEYQARELLRRGGVPVPPDAVAGTPEEAEAAAARFGGEVVVKAQAHTGGRGKAGGVRLAESPEGARHAAEQILGMTIRGLPVDRVLVAPGARIVRELYLSVTLDRSARAVSLIASADGGVEIEEVAARAPDRIITAHADPLLGLQPWQAREAALALGLEGAHVRRFAEIALRLYAVYVENDASLVEVNPLAEVEGGQLQALDAKVSLDPNALPRHPELAELRDPRQEEPSETRAGALGISYIRLDGEIGCMVNGAGLAMATMDTIALAGGRPANFLDVGGGASEEQVTAALELILEDDQVRVVLINIFGGITRCDLVARGIVAALARIPRRPPMVVRLVGTNEEEGRRILESAELTPARTLDEAARLAVERVGAGTAGR